MSSQRRLRTARKLRTQISRSLHDVQSGVLNIEDVLGDPPDALGRVRIGHLLRQCPHLGEAGTKKVLIAARVWPEDRLASLDPDDRARIVEALPARVTQRRQS